MIVNECTRDKLKGLFSSGLSDLIRDDEVKVHVVGVLDGFISERKLPIKQTVADSFIVNDLFEKGNYEALVFFGDAQLFMCGMFPEYLSKQRRHSMGIRFYVRKGIDSYNYALYLAVSKKIKNTEAALVSKLSDSFMNNVNAILQLRNRLRDGEVLQDRFLCNELAEAIGYKSNRPNLRVIQGSPTKAWKRH
ncbi:MAG: hypothetical protein ACYTEE_09945 [Planctomycetota bacterium]|jgi:hypothetical protein